MSLSSSRIENLTIEKDTSKNCLDNKDEFGRNKRINDSAYSLSVKPSLKKLVDVSFFCSKCRFSDVTLLYFPMGKTKSTVKSRYEAHGHHNFVW